MKIGIVGGSIAGCTAAILLNKHGHEVQIFERVSEDLVGRGGGIGTTPSLLSQIKKDGLIDNKFRSFAVYNMPFIGRNEESEPFGRRAWTLPIDFRVFQWKELWGQLRRHVPDSAYQRGTQVVSANMVDGNQVELKTEDDQLHQFDLVLFADGYNSLGRQLMFPQSKLKYRGYILWRGLLPEADMESPNPLGSEILRIAHGKAAGHKVMYFIPDAEGNTATGQRVCNWAAYIPIDENELPQLMKGKDGVQYTGTLPPGQITDENVSMLNEFIAQNTPKYHAEVAKRTQNSYIQVIYTVDPEHYRKDRMCLIGDAGAVAQPFTGSGVFKGYNNVKDLIQHISGYADLDRALEAWSKKQVVEARKLLALGEQMEKAYIWDQPDFAQAGEEELAAWWRASVRFPDSFNYQK